MAKDKSDRTPSADEIIEALALEMGVSNDEDSEADEDEASATNGAAAEAAPQEPDAPDEDAGEATDDAAAEAADEPDDSEPEAAQAAEDEKSRADNALASVGGIFDVPSSSTSTASKKKKRKKKAQPEPVAAAAPETADEEASEPKLAKSKPAADPAADVDGIAGIFNVSGDQPAVDDEPAPRKKRRKADVVDDQELAKFEKKAGGGMNKLLIGVIVILVLALAGVAVFATGKGDDILAVFSGTYRDKKDAEKRKIEEDYKKEQLAKLEKYGSLNVTGHPPHAFVKLQLEGDAEPHLLYAQYADDSPFTEIRLPAIFHNLKVKKPTNIVVEAEGYQPQQVTLTEPMWQETGLGEFQYALNVILTPKDPWTSEELQDRMAPYEDEDPPTAVIKVVSTPPGAKIMLNNRLVVDKEGEPIVTPTDLTHIPAKPPKEGEKEDKKKELDPIVINTPPDNGYKVEVFFDDENEPRYVTAVQRGLWKCTPKDEKEVARLPKDARPSLKCNYSSTVNADFNAIKAEIERQKKIEEELRKQKEEMERIQKEAEEKAKNL